MTIKETEIFFDEAYQEYLAKGNDFVFKFHRKLTHNELKLIETWYNTGNVSYCSSYLNPKICIFGIRTEGEMYKKMITSKELIKPITDIKIGDGSTYIAGNVTRSKVTNRNSIIIWCSSNKMFIGSIVLNIYFIFRFIF